MNYQWHLLLPLYHQCLLMILHRIEEFLFFLLKHLFLLCLVCSNQQRIISCHRPSPKGDFIDILLMDCQANLIPILSSYSFNNRVHIFLNISILIHCWNRLWRHVEPEPYSLGSIFFHWHPLVLRMYRIPSSTFLNGIMNGQSY